MKKLFAEFIGTFVLILFGCGAAVLAGQYIGVTGIALAFGIAVLVMVYAVGPISGGHFNPAVTLGLAAAGRFAWRDTIPYIVAQLLGAIIAALLLYFIATGRVAGANIGGFAANGYGVYKMSAAFITELVMTAIFLLVIIGATAKEEFKKFAGVAIGLSLTAIHLVSMPITNTSVNPARSTSQALFSMDPAALPHLWLFWVAPIAGAVLVGLLWKKFMDSKEIKKK